MTLIMPASFPGACGPVCSSYVKQTAAQSCSFNLTLALAACFWVSHSSDGVQDAESSAPGSCSHSRHSWSVAGIRGSVESSQCLRSPCVASSAGARSQAWTAGRAWLGHWRPGRGAWPRVWRWGCPLAVAAPPCCPGGSAEQTLGSTGSQGAGAWPLRLSALGCEGSCWSPGGPSSW